MIERLDKVGVGIALGALALLIGMFFTYTFFASEVSSAQQQAFLYTFRRNLEFQGNFLIMSMTLNPFLFFGLLRKDLERAAMGVVIFSLLVAIYIVLIMTNMF